MDKLKQLPFAYLLLVVLGVASVSGWVYSVRSINALAEVVSAKMYLEVLPEVTPTLEATPSGTPTGTTGVKTLVKPTAVLEEVK